MAQSLNIPTNGQPGPMASARRVSIGICMPGESFSSAWVSNWTNLFMSLLASGYDPAPLFGYSSSVFVTRASLAFEMMHSAAPIDYILWIDDDNIVTPEMFQRLKRDLEEHPEADMVAGWSWVEPNAMTGTPAIISCGRLKPNYTVEPFDFGEIKRAAVADTLLEAQYTGFPCVLMRYGLLAKAGPNPFAAILGDELRWGMTGEDLAFCVHARERGGALILVDAKVKVPHLKTAAIPDPVDQFETVDLTRTPVKHVTPSWFGSIRAPLFSLCHPTLRLPDGWRTACQAWFDLADDPSACEYILCTEEPFDTQRSTVPWSRFKRVCNEGRRTAASAWNTAGAASAGKFLITVADDFFPCPHWDSEIRKLVPDMDAPWVIAPRMSGREGFLYFSLLTRMAYQRYGGWFFYPEYWSMYADDDFTEWARREGIVIDTPLEFAHNHPIYGTAAWDPTYRWQQDPASYERGKKILERRRANGFATNPEDVQRCMVDPGRVKYAEGAMAAAP